MDFEKLSIEKKCAYSIMSVCVQFLDKLKDIKNIVQNIQNEKEKNEKKQQLFEPAYNQYNKDYKDFITISYLVINKTQNIDLIRFINSCASDVFENLNNLESLNKLFDLID